ncbi:MAG: GNAT family N-acetyltransferase [Phycisphaerales bacterium]|nr:GNAT family N-acetyltransferase [Phycisphaerales bacterium]
MREPIIQTDRLDLCVPSMDDLDALASMWSDPETMKYIGAGGAWEREKVRERIERARETFHDHSMCFWTVIERETNTIIGQGGLVPINFNDPETELGYRLGRDHWGNGYATEIARATAAYGFERLRLDRLVAVCYEENLGSRRVLRKSGFRELGESDVYYSVRTILHECTPYDLAR